MEKLLDQYDFGDEDDLAVWRRKVEKPRPTPGVTDEEEDKVGASQKRAASAVDKKRRAKLFSNFED